MDDHEQSRASDAGATRKRRSSILKLQRAPRAPFSELEFNVATPTDTSKSRRVSFSKRTGVAEFATNEATTNWKNFYEEHNKTLESSSNESGANPPPQSIGHIGKSIFDQYFQEVEAVDFVSTLDVVKSRNIETSLNINFAEQLTSLEITNDDRKLPAPHHNFELSALTDHQSKVFADDLAISDMGELTDRISVNFSQVQPIGGGIDDLDEIQRDLKAQSYSTCQGPKVMCHGPFRDDRNMSEYIEVDLNMTNAALRNDESDMSITDTISSPKVQDVSKSSVSLERKTNLNKDWVADKENILIVNPYDAPKESAHFALNEEPDKVLVFDGKRLTIQSEKDDIEEVDYRKTLLPNSIPDRTPQRKTIVFNINDDLPNISMSERLFKGMSINQTVADGELSMTQPLTTRIETNEKRRTFVYENESGNISTTEAVPANILLANVEKRRTNVYDSDSGDISLTQAVSSNIILTDKESLLARRKTIVYEDDAGDISITQAVPKNVVLPNKLDTTVFETDSGDISVTQVVSTNLVLPKPSDLMSEKRRTLFYEDDAGNISITQAVPSNLVLAENLNVTSKKDKTIVYGSESGDISVTQVVSSNIMLSEKESSVLERRKTIVYDADDGNISMTQAIPSNVILSGVSSSIPEKRQTIVFESDSGDISVTETIPSNLILPNKSSTIVYDNDSPDISNLAAVGPNVDEIHAERRKTIVYEDDAGNISITRPIPTNLIICNDTTELVDKRRTIVFETDSGNISVTEAIPANIILPKNSIHDSVSKDMSTTQAVPGTDNTIISEANTICSNIILTENNTSSYIPSSANTLSPGQKQDSSVNISTTGIDESGRNKLVIQTENIIMSEDVHRNLINEELVKRKTVVFEHDTGNMSITKPIPSEFMSIQKQLLETSKFDKIMDTTVQQDVLVYQADADNASIVKLEKAELADSKTTAIIPSYGNITTSSMESKPKLLESKDNLQTPRDSITSSLTVDSNKGRTDQKLKKTILDDLLDMSNASMESGLEDKSIMARVESQVSDKSAPKAATDSSDSLFFVTKDSEDETQTQTDNKQLDYIVEDDNVIQKNLIQFEEVDRKSSGNRYFERVMSSDFDSKEVNKSSKGLIEANSTRELLAMISNFTDKEEEEHPIDEDDKENLHQTLNVKSQLALENKSEVPLTRRLSFVPRRQSIVVSREDLINSISMAKAVLQNTRVDVDENETMNETTLVSTPMEDTDVRPKKSVRMSSDVAKTLHFEDDSFSVASAKSDMKMSPLKKTAFGEQSYMGESQDKAHVIPTFLKDVSDNIKQLMSDLTKPINDVLPFDSSSLDKTMRKAPSTCSMQIQANLTTSSQIDIDPDPYSNPVSPGSPRAMTSVLVDMAKRVLKNTAQMVSGTSLEVPSDSNVIQHEEEEEIASESDYRPPPTQTVPGRVLVFDPGNPLNNIMFQPMDYSEVHRYNPVKSNETLIASEHSTTKVTFSENDPEYRVEQVSTQFVVSHSPTPIPYTPSAGDACCEKVSEKIIVKESEEFSVASNITKTISVDRSIDAPVVNLKDTEVNTIIIMKGNKELLETSSSLTLVDDALTHDEFDVDIESQDSEDNNDPVKVIYKVDEEDPNTEMAESHDREEQVTDKAKAKKRSYSPTSSKKYQSSVDTPPKPNRKMQKLSSMPHAARNVTINNSETHKSRHDIDSTKSDRSPDPRKPSPKSKKRSPKKVKGSAKSRKEGTVITVQQLVTEYHNLGADIGKEVKCSQIIETLKNKADLVDGSESVSDVESVDAVSSSTSSKDHSVRDDRSVALTESQPCLKGKSLPMDWHPELLNELSSKNLVTECESSVNVVAKIDMLPFMGSRDCEWEASGSDTWAFRLLHGRLRLNVRLTHRHDNASRTRVRADTPVLSTTLETLHHDKKNSVAVLCVRFAAEAIRYFIGRGCARAGDVPALLRRCAGVARVALRWGRTMHDAYIRLAFSLNEDGYLALKVANIPLRSVWEVTMQLEMMVDDAREVPWPGAGAVRVAPVVTDCPVGKEEVRRALQHVRRDWGHAPRTVWKIFKYLKNKTRDDDLLLGPS